MPARAHRRRQRRARQEADAPPRWFARVTRTTTAALAVVGAFVVLAQAVEPARDSWSWIRDRVAPEHRDAHAATISKYVWVASHKLAWVKPPTIYKPSADLMRRHFADFDPYAIHRFDAAKSIARADLPALQERAPQLAGIPVTIEGTYDGATLIEAGPGASSWALYIHDARAPRTQLVCRLPADANGPPFSPKDWVLVQGVLLADGGVARQDGRGMDRVFYMACSAATRREAILTMDRKGIHVIDGNTPRPTAELEDR